MKHHSIKFLLRIIALVLPLVIGGCSRDEEGKELKHEGETKPPLESRRGGTAKKDVPGITSAIDTLYRFVGLTEERSKVTFEGYGQKDDGTYVFQIGWDDTVYTVDDGCEIRGYTVTNFEERPYTRHIPPQQKITTVEKKVELISKEKSHVLRLGKTKRIQELYANLVDLKNDKRLTLHVDSDLEVYKVKEISPHAVVLVDREGTKFQLEPQLVPTESNRGEEQK